MKIKYMTIKAAPTIQKITVAVPDKTPRAPGTTLDKMDCTSFQKSRLRMDSAILSIEIKFRKPSQKFSGMTSFRRPLQEESVKSFDNRAPSLWISSVT